MSSRTALSFCVWAVASLAIACDGQGTRSRDAGTLDARSIGVDAPVAPLDAEVDPVDAAIDALAPIDAPPAPADASRDGAAPDAAGRDAAIAEDGGPLAGARVRVHYDVGFGRRITLRGDGGGLDWTAGRDCEWSEGNVWICEVDPATGVVEVKPLVDDTTWARGTNWRVAPGATLDVFPFFFSTTGRLVTHEAFASEHLDAPHDVFVYLPPSYDESPAKSYPILVMQDGQNLFEPARAYAGVAWEIDQAIDTLAFAGPLVEPIVVGVASNADRIPEYTPTVDATLGGGDGEAYLRFVIEELVPFVRATYRTSGDRVGLAGSSLGGLITMHGCWSRPDVFDRCGALSPSFWWDERELLERVRADGSTADDQRLTIYLDSGDSGPSSDGMADTAEMRDVLVDKGFVLEETLRYVLGVGHTHTESAWRARAPGALGFLYRDPDRAPE